MAESRARVARATVLLIAAALAGTAAGLAAAAGARQATARTARELVATRDVVAVVGEVPIRRDDLERALSAIAADRRAPLTTGDRDHVLQRLVDEELLVHAALDAGFAEHDAAVRRALVDAMVSAIEAQADDEQLATSVPDYVAWLRAQGSVWRR